MKFKPGDNVTIQKSYCKSTTFELQPGTKCVVVALYNEQFNNNEGRRGRLITLKCISTGSKCHAFEEDLILTNNNKMNIKDSFTLAFKQEPEKSFRKTGITNGDDFLTEDGQKVFLSWLLKKNGVEFKKEVVDGLLEEMEESKKD